jgi:hypothetical protein
VEGLRSAQRAAKAAPARFVARVAERLLDTRDSGAPVGPGGVVNVQLPLPSWDRPTAVVLNVTAVDATTNTFITAYTADPVPSTSNPNVGPGEAVPNQVTVSIDLGRMVSLVNKFAPSVGGVPT